MRDRIQTQISIGTIFNVNDLIAYHRPAVDNILSRNHAKQYLSPREALFIIIVRRYNAPTCAEFFAFQSSTRRVQF